MIFFTLVLQATLPGTWSQEPLYSLSLRVPVHSLLFRIRASTIHSHTSTSPPPRRIQPTHLYKKTSSLARTIQHSPLGNSSRCMVCLNLRVEKHFGWSCLEWSSYIVMVRTYILGCVSLPFYFCLFSLTSDVNRCTLCPDSPKYPLLATEVRTHPATFHANAAFVAEKIKESA